MPGREPPQLAEPGAGIRIALALERAARAGVRVFIARAREAGMSWHEVGEALGVAELTRARGSSLGEAAWEYTAERAAHWAVELVAGDRVPDPHRPVLPGSG